MVNDHEFLEKVVTGIQKQMGADYDIQVEEVLKNNGVTLTGVCVRKQGAAAGPVLYLEESCLRYRAGRKMAEIVRELSDMASQQLEMMKLPLPDLGNFAAVKELVIFRLINRETNKKLLERIPHIKFHDLAVVFYLLLSGREEKLATVMINRAQMEAWKTTPSDLWKLAQENTPRLLPSKLEPVSEIVRRYLEGTPEPGTGCSQIPDSSEGIRLYALTNEKETWGAASMLYEGCLKHAAEVIGRDLAVIPSSIHETLLTAFEGEEDLSALKAILHLVNATEVKQEEVLSENIYVYRQGCGHLELAEV